MRTARIIVVSLLAAGVLCAGLAVVALRQTEIRIRQKAARAEAGVRHLTMHGGDPEPVLLLLKQVKPALDAGEVKKAEAFLDEALAMLARDGKPAPIDNTPALPIFDGQEKESSLFVDPQAVKIEGYGGNAMEPFISPDGHFLFFNNENDPKVDTNLHIAERTGRNAFKYIGALAGANSSSLDAVPSMDAAGHFYWTTLREYDRTMASIYTGDFDGTRVVNVRPVQGDLSPKTPFMVNMDASISPDGQTLYISRAMIVPGAGAPRKSELMVATRRKDGNFSIAKDGSQTMERINTGPLAYAPDISANGLELYFTRASMSKAGHATLRILVAVRSSVADEFEEPRVLSLLTGYVEAPSISSDGRELFFHKKVADKFLIYRAIRVLH